MSDVILQGADLRGCRLDGVSFHNVSMSGARLGDVPMETPANQVLAPPPEAAHVYADQLAAF
ncbi:pentapeptide repeat-containing protein, partial [Acinetobacter baumannii]